MKNPSEKLQLPKGKKELVAFWALSIKKFSLQS